MAGILSTGASALLAFQRALDVIGHNIANVNTEGYSRQRVLFSSTPGQTFGFGTIGSGVQIDGIERSTDAFINARVLESTTDQARLDRFASLTGRVDTLLSDAATGMAQPLNAFYEALAGVAANPDSMSARQALLGRAGALAGRYESVGGQLDQIDREVSGRLQQSVQEANGLIDDLGRLNLEIGRAAAQAGGTPPPDLLDRREQVLGQLAQKIGVTTTVQEDGALNVFTTGGQALVVGATTQHLSTIADPYRPQRLELALETPAGVVNIGRSAAGGEIGGVIDFRREVLDPARAELGRQAVALTETLNAQHREGMDLAGNLGGDFFAPLAPQVNAHRDNTGSGALTAAFADVGALTGDDYVLSFDGSAWSATNAATGQAVAMTGSGTGGDPFLIDGVALTVGGAPAAGDRFLVQSTADAARQVAVAIDDPVEVAAASPLTTAANLANTGAGHISAAEVLDATAPGLTAAVTIQFTSATTYSINGSGSFAYSDGGDIDVNGWRVQIDGIPATGDRFTVQAAVAGSSDNGNARALSALSSARVLDGGTASVAQSYASLVSQAGSAAQQAAYGAEAQGALTQQAQSLRASVSGVNLDEEAANLLRMQQAYQAAAQVVSVANQLFQTLLNATGR